MADPSAGPWVSFAVLCEKTIEDKGGRLSLINIVDQVNFTPPQEESTSGQPPTVAISLVAAVGFRSGVLKGPAEIKLALTKPNGEAGPTLAVNTLFQGEERGTNLVTNMNLTLNEEGLYWIEVYVVDRLMTRIPLRLALQWVTFGPTS